MDTKLKNILLTLGLVVILALLGIASSKNGGRSDTVTIGSIESLSGPATFYGEENKKGVELAKEEFAAKYPNLKFTVIHEDSLYTAKGGVDAYQKIKATTKMDAVITHASQVSLAIQPLVKADTIIQMGVSSSADKYTTPDDYSFRVSPRTEIETKTIADFIQQKGYKKLAILYMNNEIGVSVTTALKTHLSGKPVELVGEEAFALDATDFRTQILKFKQAGADIVFVPALASHTINIIKQAQENSFGAQLIGFRAAEDPTLKAASPSVDGFLYSYAYDTSIDNAENKKFTTAFEKKYGQAPSGYAAEGYESFRLLAEAFNKCGKDNACIKAHFDGLKNYRSVFGPLTFDSNGDVTYGFFLKTVKNGALVRYDN